MDWAACSDIVCGVPWPAPVMADKVCVDGDDDDEEDDDTDDDENATDDEGDKDDDDEA